MKSDTLKQFEQTYKATADMVFRFCLVKVSDREVAVDLTQETFTRLFETMQRGIAIDHPKAWLFRITRNLVIDWYRKKKSLSLEKMMEEDDAVWEPTDEKSHRDIEHSAEARMVVAAFETLEEDFRDVLHLRYVEDLEPREIALMLGLTANLVSVRLTRGMNELRKIMKTDGKK